MVIQSFLSKSISWLAITAVFSCGIANVHGQDYVTSQGWRDDRPKQNQVAMARRNGELNFETANDSPSSPAVVDLEQVDVQQSRFFSQVTQSKIILPPGQSLSTQAITVPQTANVNLNDPNLLTGEIYAAFDFMFLERSGPDPQAFVFTNGVPTLNTTAFSYDAEFSPAATIAIGDQFGYALEFSFLSSANHRFNGVQAGTNVVPVFFGGIPAAPVNSYTITSQSQMDNFELNQWVRYSDRVRLGLGLRIIDMREEFDIKETNSSDGFFSITDNEMFGGQFALQYLFYSTDRMAVYFQGKSGLYYNRVKLSATAQNVQMTPDEDELSFVGDLRLVADFPLTDILSLRAGYQATFLTRVAQGIDQNDNLNIGNPTNPGVMDFSTPTYRGGFFGIVASY